MFDAVLSDLTRFGAHLQLYLAHYPERTFLILGAALLAFGWLMRRSRRS